MKPKTKINLIALCNAIDGAGDGWQRLAPYGEHVHDNGGNPVVQIVDEKAADLIIANANHFLTRLASLNQGIPIFEGHPDVAAWKEKNPGCKAIAHGRIRQLEKRADGIYYLPIYNESGVSLTSGEAPPYSAVSANWRVVPVEGKQGYVRPVFLTSLGLTNFPNIEGTQIANEDEDLQTGEVANASDPTENTTETNTMTKEQLALLGLEENATPEQITASLNELKDSAAKAQADKAQAVSVANDATAKLEALQGTQIANEISAAVNTGRITEADKSLWESRLKANFTDESKALNALSAVHNTKAAPDVSKRSTDVTAITDRIKLVDHLAKENGLNLANEADHDKAWSLAREAKPELFQ